MLKLPENFETYSESRKNSFLHMKELKEKGTRIVGAFCSFIPKEIIRAAGAVTVGLCSATEEPITAAETHLPRNLCPLIKSSYGAALSDTCPFFYFSDLVVAETTCDGKRKMFELLNDIKPTYVMQLPNTRDTERAVKYWEGEIIALKEKLEDFYNITITEEQIKEAIHLQNKERAAMRRYLEIGMLNPCPVSGYEMGTRVDAGDFSFDLNKRIETIEARTAEILKDWEENFKGKPTNRPRILITGCPNAGTRDKIIKVVEELGADVVAYDNCGGYRSAVEPVDETLPVYEALARKYINVNCSVMSPNDKRIGFIDEMIDQFQIDGVIEIILQACHTYNVEAYKVKRHVVNNREMPYLYIETDYSQADKGQILARLTAFLETIQK